MNVTGNAALKLPLRRSIVFGGALAFIFAEHAFARRAIPDDNLAYPVLITLKNANDIPIFYGSGVYLNTDTDIYLVTAKHVLSAALPDPVTQKANIPDLSLELLSYTKDTPTPKRIVIAAKLSMLLASGYVKPHQSRDVVVVRLATVEKSNENQAKIQPLPNVTITNDEGSAIVTVSMQTVKTLDQVLVGNEAILYGYPISLTLSDNPRFDPHRPLLRKALIAGIDQEKRSIIIDGPVYRGNSGGPVFEIEAEGFALQFKLAGIVTEFIPLVERTPDMQINLNSGYSVVEPMDFVLELIK